MSIETAESLHIDFYRQLNEFPTLERNYGGPIYMAQWGLLESLRYRASEDPELAVGLIDYAAQPAPSLLARAYALDIGITASHYAVAAADKAGVEPHPGQAAIIKTYNNYLADEPKIKLNDFGLGDADPLTNDYFWFFKRLAASEGISPDLITPDAHDMGYDPSTICTQVPAAAFRLLSKLIGAHNPVDIIWLAPEVSRQALELALDFRNETYAQAVEPGTRNTIVELAKLGRLTKAGGAEHDKPVDFINQLPEAERFEYAHTLNQLFDAAQGLRHVFPNVLGDTVTRGAQGLVANALFAVQAHLKAGRKTHSQILLRGGGELSVDFEGDEPLETLRQLTNAMSLLHSSVSGDTSRFVPAAHGKGFHIDRIIDIRSAMPSKVSLYTRPHEADAFDEAYEYGRPGKGVEASISYKVLIGNEAQLSPVDKRAVTADIISIRLDREHDDVISLDVGSVLGNPDSLGTKVGRLLGWGNSLRATATGNTTSLNHVKDALDQQYGQPTAFADITNTMRRWVEIKQASKRELAAYEALARAATVGTLALSN